MAVLDQQRANRRAAGIRGFRSRVAHGQDRDARRGGRFCLVLYVAHMAIIGSLALSRLFTLLPRRGDLLDAEAAQIDRRGGADRWRA
jgi:hypothetical protein